MNPHKETLESKNGKIHPDVYPGKAAISAIPLIFSEKPALIK
jgi:hypothetical protein